MTSTGHAHEGAHAHESHSLMKYIWVFIALCILSSMSFLTYSSWWPDSLDSPAVKRLFMMAVSCAKAMLVILFFMHLKYEANWKYVLTVPASLMSAILVTLLVPDIGMRVKGAFGVGGYYAAERRRNIGTPDDVSLLKEAGAKEGSAHQGQSEH